MTPFKFYGAAAVVMSILAGGAHASIVQSLNTGVTGGGSTLSNGTIGDPQYSLFSVPGGVSAIRILTSVGGYPVGPWLGDNTLSTWIGPNNDASAHGPVGTYDYRISFDLTGFNFMTASITGQWSTDDAGTGVRLNGISTGATGGNFLAWTPLTISSGFNAGINTLDFLVLNDGGPTGLRVEGAVSANSVPEPASLLLIGVGLVGFGIFRRRLA